MMRKLSFPWILHNSFLMLIHLGRLKNIYPYTHWMNRATQSPVCPWDTGFLNNRITFLGSYVLLKRWVSLIEKNCVFNQVGVKCCRLSHNDENHKLSLALSWAPSISQKEQGLACESHTSPICAHKTLSPTTSVGPCWCIMLTVSIPESHLGSMELCWCVYLCHEGSSSSPVSKETRQVLLGHYYVPAPPNLLQFQATSSSRSLPALHIHTNLDSKQRHYLANKDSSS